MPTDQQNLKKLTRLFQAMDENSLTRDEFTKAFELVIKLITAIEKRLVTATSNGLAGVDEATKNLASKIDKKLATLKDGKSVDHNAVVKDILKLIRQPKDGSTPVIDYEVIAQKAAALIPTPSDGSPDTADDIRNKLELLPEGEKLHIDAIEDLRKELNELKKLTAQRGGGGVIAYSRGQIKLYDLSDLLDGATKTFALPAFWRVLTVQSTSTPNAFRPTVDYTTDASAMTVTFTAQIDAASTLASGQTLTVLYAEP